MSAASNDNGKRPLEEDEHDSESYNPPKRKIIDIYEEILINSAQNGVDIKSLITDHCLYHMSGIKLMIDNCNVDILNNEHHCTNIRHYLNNNKNTDRYNQNEINLKNSMYKSYIISCDKIDHTVLTLIDLYQNYVGRRKHHTLRKHIPEYCEITNVTTMIENLIQSVRPSIKKNIEQRIEIMKNVIDRHVPLDTNVANGMILVINNTRIFINQLIGFMQSFLAKMTSLYKFIMHISQKIGSHGSQSTPVSIAPSILAPVMAPVASPVGFPIEQQQKQTVVTGSAASAASAAASASASVSAFSKKDLPIMRPPVMETSEQKKSSETSSQVTTKFTAFNPASPRRRGRPPTCNIVPVPIPIHNKESTSTDNLSLLAEEAIKNLQSKKH